MKIILIILLLSCAKQVEPEHPTPRILLPELDEEWDLEDLPEADEEDTGSEE